MPHYLIDEFWDIVRILNVVLSLYLSVINVIRYARFDENVSIRMHRLALAGLLVGDAAMTFNAWIHQFPAGPILYAMTVPLVWLLIAQHWNLIQRLAHHDERQAPGPPWDARWPLSEIKRHTSRRRKGDRP